VNYDTIMVAAVNITVVCDCMPRGLQKLALLRNLLPLCHQGRKWYSCKPDEMVEASLYSAHETARSAI